MCKLCNGVRFVQSPISGIPQRCPCAGEQTILLMMLEAVPSLPGACSACARGSKSGGVLLLRRQWVGSDIRDGWGVIGSDAQALPLLASALCQRCAGFLTQGVAAFGQAIEARARQNAPAGIPLGPLVRSCGLL